MATLRESVLALALVACGKPQPAGDAGVVDLGGDASMCMPNQTLCPSGCADLESDPLNCGRCGHGCRGGDCGGGVCQPIKLAQGNTTGLAGRSPGERRNERLL